MSKQFLKTKQGSIEEGVTSYEQKMRNTIIFRYSGFHRFREAKFGNDGSILSSSQFSLLP